MSKATSRKLSQQSKKANIRSKYGPSMKPSMVTIKALDGQVKSVVDQSRLRAGRSYSEVLELLAQAAGYSGYAAYLQSSHWKSLRRRVLQRDRYRCVLCKTKRRRLQVHHDRYTNLGHEPLEDLKTLCNRCHERIHG